MSSGYLRLYAYADGSCATLDASDCKTQLSIMGWHITAQPIKAIALHVPHLRRPNADATLARAKVAGLYVMDANAQTLAKQRGYDSALFLNQDGTLCEAAGANLFLVKNDELYTPLLTNTINGITSSILQALAKAENIPCHVTNLALDDLISADEAFLTGTLSELKPIRAIEHNTLPAAPGDITTTLLNAYQQLINNNHPLASKWVTVLSTLATQAA